MEVEEEMKQRMSTRSWAEMNEYNSTKLFHKVGVVTFTCYTGLIIWISQLFYTDIQYLLTMEKLWQTRRPPTPLLLDSLPETSQHINTVY